MEYMYDLKDMLCKELKEYAKKGELSAGSLETIDKLTHSLKSVVTIMAMEDGGYSRDNGYSGRRDSMGRYADGASYNNGSYEDHSYGRYNDGYSGRRYSRDEGKNRMTQQFEEMMQEANSQEERELLRSTLNRLKNM